MVNLLLGPILRHVGTTDATIWVETDSPCVVDVLGRRSATFQVRGHHYGLVAVRGLAPGSVHPYEIVLDGHTAWPRDASVFPASVIRTIDPLAPLRVAFGSCRVTAPHESPADPSHGRRYGPDALRALAARMCEQPPETWPNALLLLGDQVYADDPSPQTRAFMRARRDTSGPHGEEVTDFDEYARLYQEAWQEPWVRWLFSVVGTTMLWDDHDVHDDWNISHAWVQGVRSQRWWSERLTAATMTYWIYQHLGNLSPDALDADDLLAQMRAAPDGEPALRAFARRAADCPPGPRWSVCRDYGSTRLLALDCRSRRMLTPGARSMLFEDEWRWLEHQAHGDFDHLLVAVPDPYLLAPALHHLEAWSEAVCDGAWGRACAALGERLRRALDLDHWAAFGASFERLTELFRRVGAGRYGEPPATIVTLTGDVHHCELFRIVFAPSAGVISGVYEAVCSPLRNPLGTAERLALRLAASGAIGRLVRALAASAGVPEPTIRWDGLAGPWFDNQIAALELRGRSAVVRYERAVSRDREPPRLELLTEHRLTPPDLDAAPTPRVRNLPPAVR